MVFFRLVEQAEHGIIDDDDDAGLDDDKGDDKADAGAGSGGVDVVGLSLLVLPLFTLIGG